MTVIEFPQKSNHSSIDDSAGHLACPSVGITAFVDAASTVLRGGIAETEPEVLKSWRGTETITPADIEHERLVLGALARQSPITARAMARMLSVNTLDEAVATYWTNRFRV